MPPLLLVTLMNSWINVIPHYLINIIFIIMENRNTHSKLLPSPPAPIQHKLPSKSNLSSDNLEDNSNSNNNEESEDLKRSPLDLEEDDMPSDEMIQEVLKVDKDMDNVFLELVDRLHYYLKRTDDLGQSIAKLEKELQAKEGSENP